MDMDSLVAQILLKPEFVGLSKELVFSELNVYLRKRNILKKDFTKKDEKLIIKDIRSNLRLLTGRFQNSQKDRNKLLESNNFTAILNTHTSTKERVAIYPKIKELINTLDIVSILDLGCGLNPLALAEKKIKYYASDIREDELNIIKKYFKTMNSESYTFSFDLRNHENYSSLPPADLVLIFKVLDIIEKKSHKIATKLISELKCKYALISFATRKISGKKMNSPKRKWFESILFHKSLMFKKFIFENEVFYLIDFISSKNNIGSSRN